MTRSLLEAGEPTTAVQRARRCISICEQNQAPAFERFFAYAALARALLKSGDQNSFAASRDAAFAWFDRVPSEEREWCETERQVLVSV